MNFLRRIQSLPESRKKIILWSVVIIVGLVLFILWARNAQEKLKIFQKEGFKIPSLKEELKEMPSIELPEISEEELKELEKEFKKSEATTTGDSNEPR